MKFKEYLVKCLESSSSKRNVTGPYAKSMYPKQYALGYRLQYSPDSAKNEK